MFTLKEKFIAVCEEYPGRRAVQDFTFGEIFRETKTVAGWLMAQGVGKSDRVVILLDNCQEWIFVYFAVMLCGAIAVPLDPQMSKETIAAILKDCHPKIVIDEDKLKSISKKDLPVFPPPSFPQINIEDLASILYTSGTTAVPKGVALSHANFAANFLSIQQLNLCSKDDVFLALLPFFHAYAFMATLIFPLFLGAQIVLPASLRKEEIQECLQKFGVTVLAGVPELFHNLDAGLRVKINPFFAAFLKKPIRRHFGKQLRYMISGGARLEPKVCRHLTRLGFTVLEGYGLTETSPIVTLNLPGEVRCGSVGKPIPGVKIKIVNPDERGIGEVVISGANVMPGYYNLPEETQKVLKDGWFYSADLGYIDQQGYLYLTGRNKEVIVLSSGKNIYPEEIEAHYARSRFIKEICVLGVKQNNQVILKAVSVPNFAYFTEHSLSDIEGKIKWDLENFSAELPAHQRLMGFLLTKEPLPRTRLGKIRRYAVEEKYLGELCGVKKKRERTLLTEADELLLNSPVGKKIKRFLIEELALKEGITPQDHLELDLGMDSLSKVDLIVGLEGIFGVSIPDDALSDVQTVRNLIEKIETLVSAGVTQEKTLPWPEILQRQPRKEILKAIELKPGLLNRFLTLIVINFLRLMFRILFLLKVNGARFLPKQGPYILCSNHASYLDAFAILAAAPFSSAINIYFIGAREIFLHPSIRWALKLARLVPIDPAAEFVPAMEAAGYLLRHGKILCIFPEGQRSIDGRVEEFKKGIGILAGELEIPVLPVGIKGSEKAWGRAVRFPKPYPIKLNFGPALNYKEFTKPAAETTIDKYQLISEGLRKAVIRLLNEDSG